MKAALNRLHAWFDGRELPSAGQSFAWLQQFPIGYWQTVVVLLLTLVLALAMAKLFWLLFTPTLNATNTSQGLAINTKTASVTQQAAVDIAALKSLALFGNAEALPSSVEEKPKEQPIVVAAEETKLDLVLMGIVGSNQQDAARAIIAKGNQQDIFAPGDKLPVGNRVTLEQVLKDRVILNNSGRYESLLLYEEGAGYESTPERVQPTRTSRRAPIQIPERAKQALEAGNIPESINDVIKLTVAREGNQVIGYRVRPGRYRQLFDQFGFKTGDVVTHVNGIGVDDPSKAMSVYREVRTAEAARFELLRNGEVITLEVDLADVDLGDG